MKKIVLFLIVLQNYIFASVSDAQIANMFMLGFYGTSVNDRAIKADICKGLGGVIVFQKNPVSRGTAKNFTTSNSLKALTNDLNSCGTKPLIAVDQEGGVVQRVKFGKSYPKASAVAKMGYSKASKIYSKMAYELKSVGVNLDLAPVADMALNPQNRVIVKWGRSYGMSADSVIAYDKIFINTMHKYGVAISLKHFPGHGSSLGDTHKGFVDVTHLWHERELKPYYALRKIADTVMVAHIFNRKLDAKYPASLSRKIITGILREKIGYRGVVISDDLQMGAISKHYGLKQSITLAMNAGVDILLFANQVHPKKVVKINYLISIVRGLLNSGAVSESSIKAANVRIDKLKSWLH